MIGSNNEVTSYKSNQNNNVKLKVGDDNAKLKVRDDMRFKPSTFHVVPNGPTLVRKKLHSAPVTATIRVFGRRKSSLSIFYTFTFQFEIHVINWNI